MGDAHVYFLNVPCSRLVSSDSVRFARSYARASLLADVCALALKVMSHQSCAKSLGAPFIRP